MCNAHYVKLPPVLVSEDDTLLRGKELKNMEEMMSSRMAPVTTCTYYWKHVERRALLGVAISCFKGLTSIIFGHR